MRFLHVVFLFMLISGCSLVPPAFTKNEMKESYIEKFVRDGNYKYLAKYWDDNAKKAMIDWKSATYLQIWDDQGVAEITIGTGPYYGMIELIDMGDKTMVVSYGRGGLAGRVKEWMDLIRGAP